MQVVSTLGLGTAPLGASALAFGTPGLAPTPGAAALTSGGVATGARRISTDPATRGRYVIGDDGSTEGMSATQQAVLLAYSTVRGSAAAVLVGHDLADVRKLGPDVAAQIERLARAPIQRLLDAGLVVFRGIRVETDGPSGRVGAVVDLYDNSAASGRAFSVTL